MASTKIKYKKIDLGFVKKNYPVLFDTLNAIAEGKIEDPKLKTYAQCIAGLCVEIALKSDGTVDLFEDDLPDDLLKDDDYEQF